jgi:hypothetical protein
MVSELLKQMDGQRALALGMKRIIPEEALRIADIQTMENDLAKSEAKAWFTENHPDWMAVLNMEVWSDGHVRIRHRCIIPLFIGVTWGPWEKRAKHVTVEEQSLVTYGLEQIPERVMEEIEVAVSHGYGVDSMVVLYPVANLRPKSDPIIAVKLGGYYYEVGQW